MAFTSIFLYYLVDCRFISVNDHYRAILRFLLIIASAVSAYSINSSVLGYDKEHRSHIKFLRIDHHLIMITGIILFVAYLFNILFDFGYLNPILDMLSGQDEKIDSYTENSEFWFEEEAIDEKYTRNPIVLVFEILGNSALFYYGYEIIKYVRKNDRISCTLYNTYIIGTYIMVAFRNLEILNRIGYVYQLFWFYPLCLVLYYFPKCKFSLIKKLILCFLIFFMYSYLKYLFFKEREMTLFLWDSPYW